MAIDPPAGPGWPRPRSSSGSRSRPAELYDRKEAEFPVRVGLTRFLAERAQGQQSPRYDRDGLAAWATDRFGVYIDPEEIRSKLRPEIEALLLDVAHREYPAASWPRSSTIGSWSRKPTAAGPAPSRSTDLKPPSELAAWATVRVRRAEVTPKGSSRSVEEARKRLVDALDAKHRPEMREMEKVLVLQILDQSWMEHLRTMDHLRSSVGLRGYAQVDPKVEYKREGMKIFEEMWSGVSDKVTDLVFRMEQLDPDFLSYLGSRWQLDRAQAIHRAPEPEVAAVAGGVRAAQDAAIAADQSPTEVKKEPVRNPARKSAGTTPARAGLVKSSRRAT